MTIFRQILARIGALPQTLLAVLLFFAILPFWSLSFQASASLLVIAVYWVLPVLLCTAIVLRLFMFVPLFVIECAGLLFHAVNASDGVSPTMFVVRIVSLSIVAATGLVLTNRDFLFPLIQKNLRGWRRAPRLHGHARLYLKDAKGATREPVLLEDFSASGLAVCGNKASIQALAVGAGRGARGQVTWSMPGQESLLNCEVMWIKDYGNLRRLGLNAVVPAEMEAFIETLGPRIGQRSFSYRMQRLWVKNAVRRTAIVLWTASLIGAFGVPACGQLDHSDGRSAVAEQDGSTAPVIDDHKQVEMQWLDFFGRPLDGSAAIIAPAQVDVACASGVRQSSTFATFEEGLSQLKNGAVVLAVDGAAATDACAPVLQSLYLKDQRGDVTLFSRVEPAEGQLALKDSAPLSFASVDAPSDVISVETNITSVTIGSRHELRFAVVSTLEALSASLVSSGPTGADGSQPKFELKTAKAGRDNLYRPTLDLVFACEEVSADAAGGSDDPQCGDAPFEDYTAALLPTATVVATAETQADDLFADAPLTLAFADARVVVENQVATTAEVHVPAVAKRRMAVALRQRGAAGFRSWFIDMPEAKDAEQTADSAQPTADDATKAEPPAEADHDDPSKPAEKPSKPKAPDGPAAPVPSGDGGGTGGPSSPGPGGTGGGTGGTGGGTDGSGGGTVGGDGGATGDTGGTDGATGSTDGSGNSTGTDSEAATPAEVEQPPLVELMVNQRRYPTVLLRAPYGGSVPPIQIEWRSLNAEKCLVTAKDVNGTGQISTLPAEGKSGSRTIQAGSVGQRVTGFIGDVTIRLECSRIALNGQVLADSREIKVVMADEPIIKTVTLNGKKPGETVTVSDPMTPLDLAWDTENVTECVYVYGKTTSVFTKQGTKSVVWNDGQGWPQSQFANSSGPFYFYCLGEGGRSANVTFSVQRQVPQPPVSLSLLGTDVVFDVVREHDGDKQRYCTADEKGTFRLVLPPTGTKQTQRYRVCWQATAYTSCRLHSYGAANLQIDEVVSNTSPDGGLSFEDESKPRTFTLTCRTSNNYTIVRTATARPIAWDPPASVTMSLLKFRPTHEPWAEVFFDGIPVSDAILPKQVRMGQGSSLTVLASSHFNSGGVRFDGKLWGCQAEYRGQGQVHVDCQNPEWQSQGFQRDPALSFDRYFKMPEPDFKVWSYWRGGGEGPFQLKNGETGSFGTLAPRSVHYIDTKACELTENGTSVPVNQGVAIPTVETTYRMTCQTEDGQTLSDELVVRPTDSQRRIEQFKKLQAADAASSCDAQSGDDWVINPSQCRCGDDFCSESERNVARGDAAFCALDCGRDTNPFPAFTGAALPIPDLSSANLTKAIDAAAILLCYSEVAEDATVDAAAQKSRYISGCRNARQMLLNAGVPTFALFNLLPSQVATKIAEIRPLLGKGQVVFVYGRGFYDEKSDRHVLKRFSVPYDQCDSSCGPGGSEPSVSSSNLVVSLQFADIDTQDVIDAVQGSLPSTPILIVANSGQAAAFHQVTNSGPSINVVNPFVGSVAERKDGCANLPDTADNIEVTMKYLLEAMTGKATSATLDDLAGKPEFFAEREIVGGPDAWDWRGYHQGVMGGTYVTRKRQEFAVPSLAIPMERNDSSVFWEVARSPSEAMAAIFGAPEHEVVKGREYMPRLYSKLCAKNQSSTYCLALSGFLYRFHTVLKYFRPHRYVSPTETIEVKLEGFVESEVSASGGKVLYSGYDQEGYSRLNGHVIPLRLVHDANIKDSGWQQYQGRVYEGHLCLTSSTGLGLGAPVTNVEDGMCQQLYDPYSPPGKRPVFLRFDLRNEVPYLYVEILSSAAGGGLHRYAFVPLSTGEWVLSPKYSPLIMPDSRATFRPTLKFESDGNAGTDRVSFALEDEDEVAPTPVFQ